MIKYEIWYEENGTSLEGQGEGPSFEWVMERIQFAYMYVPTVHVTKITMEEM